MSTSEISKLATDGGEPVISPPIPLHRPWLGEEELAAVREVFASGWITTGPATQRFESAIREYTGAAWAVGTNSCTAALHLSLLLNHVGAGDEVIVPALTFPATANCVVHCGATPIFCDVDPLTWCLDPTDARSRITERTKAVVPVHLAGVPADLDAIHAWADEEGIAVTEDAAHALESKYRGRKIGAVSPQTCLSFYATKNITTGEGGMLLGTVPEQEAIARHWGNHGISSDAYSRHGSRHLGTYELEFPGYKYNMFDIVAAIGTVQFGKLDYYYQRRERLMSIYHARLGDRDDMVFQGCRSEDKSALHLAIIKLKPEMLRVDRLQIAGAILAEGVCLGVHYRPLHLLKFYHERNSQPGLSLPVAEELGQTVLTLPLFPRMTDADAGLVAAAVAKVLDYYHRD
jgi:dTDP-4-amino-4,6-dideoxygalactose transaminase